MVDGRFIGAFAHIPLGLGSRGKSEGQIMKRVNVTSEEAIVDAIDQCQGTSKVPLLSLQK
jgi:hypothetical protein